MHEIDQGIGAFCDEGNDVAHRERLPKPGYSDGNDLPALLMIYSSVNHCVRHAAL